MVLHQKMTFSSFFLQNSPLWCVRCLISWWGFVGYENDEIFSARLSSLKNAAVTFPWLSIMTNIVVNRSSWYSTPTRVCLARSCSTHVESGRRRRWPIPRHPFGPCCTQRTPSFTTPSSTMLRKRWALPFVFSPHVVIMFCHLFIVSCPFLFEFFFTLVLIN